ncbi:MAG: hypothetical protein JWN64_233 [Parcubacteria group bacterium]|nr:hypothetical protein [Parcubacteria group bacterium]
MDLPMGLLLLRKLMQREHELDIKTIDDPKMQEFLSGLVALKKVRYDFVFEYGIAELVNPNDELFEECELGGLPCDYIRINVGPPAGARAFTLKIFCNDLDWTSELKWLDPE